MPENTSTDTTAAEVERLDGEFMQAAIEADTATLESVMSDDYVFISGVGRMMNREEHLNSLKSGEIKYKSFTYDTVKVRTYGDTAVLTGRIMAEGENAGQNTSGAHLITRVYVNRGGRWVIVSAQA